MRFSSRLLLATAAIKDAAATAAIKAAIKDAAITN